MKIDRIKNRFGYSYDYCLMDGNKNLDIFFAGNLDLYMILSTNKLLPPGENISMDFDITKEDYDLYLMFDTVYKRIVTGKIFNNPDLTKYDETYEQEQLVDKDLNITWISDDGPSDIEDRLVISKEEDSYKLTFIRNDKPMDFGFKNNRGITVRFRNSGSRYNPFNCVFMELYYNLQTIDPECRQISIEEYLHQSGKKLTK